MSRLILIRHGQARAFEEDSDRLSDLGVEQALAAGRYLVSRGVEIDNVIHGAMVRQSHTAALIGEGFSEWPQPTVDARWNEYDAVGVLRHLGPSFALEDADFARDAAAAEQHRKTPEANRYFQRMFERLMNRWTAGAIGHPDVEPWLAFRERVTAALSDVLEIESQNVLVVSSGGPIATVVQIVMEAAPRQALELNWRMRNASITEILFSRGRVTLDQFNAVPHLEPKQISYR